MTASAGPATAGSGESGAGSPVGASRGRRGLVWVLVVGVVLLGVILLGAPGEEGLPYEPTSTGELGTRGVVLLLEAFDAEVAVTEEWPAADTDIVLVLPYQLRPDDEERLREWAAAGGTVVVADEQSGLNPGRGSAAELAGFSERVIERRTCTIEALAAVERLEIDGGSRFSTDESDERCFTREDDGFVVVRPTGDGQIVSLGSPTVLVNENLGDEDNAALVTALLAPQPGTRVDIVRSPGGEGVEPQDLSSLMSVGVRLALIQGFLAFLVYAVFRGRRLGRPLSEPQPVLIAGSELVSAVGNLLQQTRNPGRAAEILRADLRRALTDRLGLPPGATPELIADTAAGRTGIDPERVRYAVTDQPVPDEAALLAVARLVDEIREEILHDHAP